MARPLFNSKATILVGGVVLIAFVVVILNLMVNTQKHLREQSLKLIQSSLQESVKDFQREVEGEILQLNLGLSDQTKLDFSNGFFRLLAPEADDLQIYTDLHLSEELLSNGLEYSWVNTDGAQIDPNGVRSLVIPLESKLFETDISLKVLVPEELIKINYADVQVNLLAISGISGLLLLTLLLYASNQYRTQEGKAKDAQDRLDESASQLRALLESPDHANIYSLDRDYNYIHFNSIHKREMRKYFNAEKPEIGKSIFEVLPNDIASSLKEYFDRAFESGYYTITRKMKGLYFNLTFNPIYDIEGNVTGVTSSLIDITEKVKIQQQLDEYHENLEKVVEDRTKELMVQRDFFQKVIDNNPNLIFVRNSKGEYILVNQATALSFESTDSTILGKTIAETHWDPSQADNFFKEDQEVLDKGVPYTSEFIHLQKDGTKRWLYLKKQQMEVNGERFVLGVHTDITELKKKEEQLKNSNEELTSALDKLKQAQTSLVKNEKLASLGQLMAGLAHEINNPINYVAGNVSPLKRDFVDIKKLISLIDQLREELPKNEIGDEIRSTLEDLDVSTLLSEISMLIEGIETGTRRVKELMMNLKNFSRKDNEVDDEVDINEVLNSTIVLIRPSVKDKIEIIQDIHPVSKVKGRPGELSQVFLNIMDNAFHAMGDKGQFKIISEEKNGKVLIHFIDNGPGIPEDIRRKIFDPFFTTKEVGEGTGLGLAISHDIIVKHKGELHVHSEMDAGTTFIIELPAVSE